MNDSETSDHKNEQRAQSSEGEQAPGRRSYGQIRRDRIDALAAASVGDEPGVSLFATAWLRLRRNPVFLLGLAITIAFVVLAILSPWFAPCAPAARPFPDKLRPSPNPVPGH